MVAPLTTGTSTATSTATSIGTAATPAASSKSQIAGNFSDFLKLLMTQLKNQDPTAPLDTNQFTQQLVQFSGVEQQLNTNTSLTKLIALQEGGQVLQSSALIGKTVQVASDQIGLQGGSGAIQLQMPGGGTADIAVYGPAGAKLRDAQVTAAPGTSGWHWDGRDNNGRVLPDGAYTIAVTSSGAAVPFTVSGTATSMQRGASGLTVQVGGVSVPLTAVQSVM